MKMLDKRNVNGYDHDVTAEDLIKFLDSLESGCEYLETGLCDAVQQALGATVNDKAFNNWPYHSCVADYPVPCPHEFTLDATAEVNGIAVKSAAEYVFWFHGNFELTMSGDDEYGNMRMNLIKWLIKELESGRMTA